MKHGTMSNLQGAGVFMGLGLALAIARKQSTGDLSERVALTAGGDEIDDLLRTQEKVANHVSGILSGAMEGPRRGADPVPVRSSRLSG